MCEFGLAEFAVDFSVEKNGVGVAVCRLISLISLLLSERGNNFDWRKVKKLLVSFASFMKCRKHLAHLLWLMVRYK
jgi:hypothetical protein